MRRPLTILALLCTLTMASRGQGLPYTGDYLGPDSLVVHEWLWLGFRAQVMTTVHFGDLTVEYATGTAPGAEPLAMTTTGGIGYGGGAQAVIEVRPSPTTPIAFLLGGGLDYRYATARASEVVTADIYAYNAIFEAVSKQLYATFTLEGRYNITINGWHLFAGVDAELPISGNRASMWQHEIPTGEKPGEDPGAPNTSIKYKTEIDYSMRIGGHIGFGKDMMVGLFGYRNQLLTPYVAVFAGSPITTTPTPWNMFNIKAGATWRIGLF